MKYAYVAEGFLNHNTSTSRLSSNNPNAQNFPRSTEDPNDLHYEYGPKKLFTSRFGEDKGVIMQLDYCLAGDTLVELAGGGQMEIKEIVERVQRGEDIHVYSTNPETFETVVSRVERGALTFKNAPTMKLTLDNGETVIATPEHRFMLRDGSYMEAGDLEDGEELGDFWGYAHNPEPKTYQDRNKNRRLEINRVERVLEARGRKINRRNWTQYSSPERGVSFGEAVDELVIGGYRNGVVSVVSVEPWEAQDVYCIKVENFSNFALGAGIVSKNSQLELRLAAVFSEDEGLKSAYAQGKDLHIFVASRVFKIPEEQVTKTQRSHSKAIGFGLIYGKSAPSLAEDLGVSRDEAQEFIDSYFDEFPGIKKWMDGQRRKVKQDKYVETLSGFRRWLKGIDSNNPGTVRDIERQAINTPIQGSGATMTLQSVIDIGKALKHYGLKSVMIMTVHDSIVFDVAPGEVYQVAAIAKTIMENLQFDWITVPIVSDIEIGRNYQDLVEVDFEDLGDIVDNGVFDYIDIELIKGKLNHYDHAGLDLPAAIKEEATKLNVYQDEKPQ